VAAMAPPPRMAPGVEEPVMNPHTVDNLLALIHSLRELIATREANYEMLCAMAREVSQQRTDVLMTNLAAMPRSDKPNTGNIAVAILEAELARRTPASVH